ncbi:MAG: hypothetical protein M3530_03975 [Thermoproteota archaeon]|nr:hypothetical protein [Thermoproteota archaeon]
MKTKSQSETDTWSLYLYSMKSPITKEKYQRSLNRFFDFIYHTEFMLRLMGFRRKDGSEFLYSLGEVRAYDALGLSQT